MLLLAEPIENHTSIYDCKNAVKIDTKTKYIVNCQTTNPFYMIFRLNLFNSAKEMGQYTNLCLQGEIYQDWINLRALDKMIANVKSGIFNFLYNFYQGVH